MLPYLKNGSFLGPKKPPEAAWVPHTWLLEKKGMFGAPKTAGGSLGTARLAFKEKGIICWARCVVEVFTSEPSQGDDMEAAKKKCDETKGRKYVMERSVQ